MKKRFFIPLTAAVCAAAAIAAPTTLRRYRIAQPVKVIMPAMSDSVDNNGNKYEAAKLLDNRMTTDFKRLKSTVTDTDTAGRVRLQSPAEGYEVVLMQTNIRAQRYAKGQLKVTSANRFEVLVGDESKAKKTTAEDSVSSASTQSVALELEPERDYTVTIKVLTEAGAKATPEVMAEFVADDDFANIPVTADPVMKRRFYVNNCTDGTRIYSTELSADGKYVLSRYGEYISPDNYRRYASVADAKTGKVLNGTLPYSAAWMPTGNTLYYTEAGKKDYNLYTVDVPTMSSRLLIKELESSSPVFSPDGKFIIYYRLQEGTKEDGIMRRIKTPDDRQPGNRDRYSLVKQDVASGNTVTLTYGSRNNSMLDISPDSKKLLYLSVKETPDQWPFYLNSLVEMDLTTLRTDTIISNDGAMNGATYSPDGKQLLVIGGPNMLGGINLNAGNHPIANDFDIQAAILDLATRKATPITRDFDPSINGMPVWNRVDGNIYICGVEGFYQNLYSYNPKTAKFTKLPLKVDVVRNFDMGRNEARYISYVGSTLSSDGQAYVYNVANRSSILLDDPLNEVIGDIEFGKSEKWTFTASDGTTIDGEMTLPPDFDPNKKYPLIVYYYGGTTPSNHRIDHPYNPNTFASRDYVVYVINPSGTIGYGQEFSARHVNAWGKRTAEDIIEGVKAFCKAHPFVNDKKIGCLGASYGGFMTQYLQTQTDIFAAAVSHAGISDVTSYWGEGYWGYSYNAVAAAKSYPWTDPELFTKQGSLFNADKIHTPLLLLHGTVDTNVPIGESIQLFNALKILGRDCEFITVEGSDHVVTHPEKRRVWQNTIMAWFAKYLQDDPSWWNSLYGDKK